jgi:hypothetical protein
VIVDQLEVVADHLRLHHIRKQFSIQQLIALFGVERLAVPILPRAARLDVQDKFSG